MSAITRYSFECECGAGGPYRASDGPYVSYADHAAELAAIKAERDGWRQHQSNVIDTLNGEIAASQAERERLVALYRAERAKHRERDNRYVLEGQSLKEALATYDATTEAAIQQAQQAGTAAQFPESTEKRIAAVMETLRIDRHNAMVFLMEQYKPTPAPASKAGEA